MIGIEFVHQRLALRVDLTEMFENSSDVDLRGPVLFIGDVISFVGEKVDESMDSKQILFVQPILVFLLAMTDAFGHT